MKRIFILLIGAILSISASFAQVLEQGEAALVYYSPKSAACRDYKLFVRELIGEEAEEDGV